MVPASGRQASLMCWDVFWRLQCRHSAQCLVPALALAVWNANFSQTCSLDARAVDQRPDTRQYAGAPQQQQQQHKNMVDERFRMHACDVPASAL